MRRALFVVLLFGAMTWVHGSEVVLTSPDRARTFAYGEMIWRQLSVYPGTQQLAARITFSNVSFAGGSEERVDEPFDFRFPGTHVDPVTKTIFVRDHRGNRITVARFRGNPSCGGIDLTAEAKILLLKESGRVTAILTATSEPRSGMRWLQRDNNCSLQNILASLWNG